MISVGKEIQIQIYGSDGALFYHGNDHDPASGRLELRRGKAGSDVDNEGSVKVLCEDLGFHFENTDKDGTGPESLQSFISACLGKQDYYVGADSLVGLRSVQTLDAMYRSNQSGTAEEIAFRAGKRAGGVRSSNREKSPTPSNRSRNREKSPTPSMQTFRNRRAQVQANEDRLDKEEVNEKS